ncbi:MAG: DUF167 domain-containing protein [Candidatus Methanomethylophilus sp.]|jgi:uncharacterized protein (TIGR00251 family)|nr:DUF167 domain-containing protein [Methanomethylophilus sp.]MCI2074887.1 DUF167 domain-containing protein [Methanomethylophilus sp.]MCI2093575.1 DUF167 domain-containing protein [Methanomethylophilus sp.]
MRISDVSRRRPDGLEIDVLVSPRSPKRCLDGFDEWRKRLIVRVRAPPVGGKADEDVCDLFSEIAGCRSEITAGMTSRQKTVLVRGDAADIEAALEKAAESDR